VSNQGNAEFCVLEKERLRKSDVSMKRRTDVHMGVESVLQFRFYRGFSLSDSANLGELSALWFDASQDESFLDR
jgi:hypothetical protein